MAASCVLEYAENGEVAVLKMVKADNRLNLEFLNDFLRCLEEAERYYLLLCCVVNCTIHIWPHVVASLKEGLNWGQCKT